MNDKNLALSASDAATSSPPTAAKRGVPHMALTMTDQGTLKVEIDGDWKGINSAAGAVEVAHWIATQLSALGDHGQRISEAASNHALASVSEMTPRDAAELLLLAQIAAVHQATMTMARRLNHVETRTRPSGRSTSSPAPSRGRWRP